MQDGNQLFLLLKRLIHASTECKTYVDVIVQLYSSRAIQLHLFQRLPDHIVRLPLRCLSGLDDRGFVNVSSVVDIELTKGILETEDIGLVKLRIFPGGVEVLARR